MTPLTEKPLRGRQTERRELLHGIISIHKHYYVPLSPQLFFHRLSFTLKKVQIDPRMDEKRKEVENRRKVQKITDAEYERGVICLLIGNPIQTRLLSVSL